MPVRRRVRAIAPAQAVDAMTRIVDTVIVGAGQAGLALSRHLAAARHDHVLLERGRVGERWRSERWPSLSLLSPNWLNTLPGSPPHGDPDGYLTVSELVTYFERYAASFRAPVHEGVTVVAAEQRGGGFLVRTDADDWSTRQLVVATGDCDIPIVPDIAWGAPDEIQQLHASRYRSPAELAPGAVLVVGAGPTGQQLALELRRAGRDVTIAVGRHARSVRRYRGRDIFAWLDELGELHRPADEVPDLAAALAAPSMTLTGSNGGEQLDLGVLRRAGVTVAGRLDGFAGRHALFAGDLAGSVADADRRLRRLLAKIDEQAGGPGEAVPPLELPEGPRRLDLAAAGVSTVLWATGYRRSYPWLHVPVLGPDGEIAQAGGVTDVPGLYTLGRRFQHRRSSHFIGGVGADAELLAGSILERSARLPLAA
jgi:putative flavoprotein involved in K+ transport